VDAFIVEVWGRKACIVRKGQPNDFAGLFGVCAIETFLQYVWPDQTAVHLVRTDHPKSPDDFRLSNGSVDMVRIRNYFADGYTLVLNGLDRHVPAISTLAHAIEVELNFETQVNAYITPPKSQGFLAHYDDHDVLILQIDGSKTWHVYGPEADVPPRLLPLRNRFAVDGLPEPDDLLLEAGDVLYLPRGRVHAAEAQEEPSIHLTIGIHPPTVMALAVKTLESLSLRDDRLLGQLPPRYLTKAAPRRPSGRGLATWYGTRCARFDGAALSEGVSALEDLLVRRGRCSLAGRLVADAVDAGQISAMTWVEKSHPLYSRVLALTMAWRCSSPSPWCRQGLIIAPQCSICRGEPGRSRSVIFLTSPSQSKSSWRASLSWTAS
jgi:bifunctional lysine-specific demethylase and histidyl-hydroxylase NO66